MILIDNIKTSRSLFYFFKLNTNLKKYKYIFFCYNSKQSIILKNLINTQKLNYYFLKKLKNINYLTILYQYLVNSLVLYCTNDFDSLSTIINELTNSIIFCKVENNFYSLNSVQNFINSKYDLVNYLNSYYFNFITILSILKKQ